MNIYRLCYGTFEFSICCKRRRLPLTMRDVAYYDIMSIV